MDKSKFRMMEDEMSRFEAEISGQPAMVNSYGPTFIPAFGAIPPPPAPPMLIPHQISRKHIFQADPVITPQQVVVSAKPTLYAAPKPAAAPAPAPAPAAPAAPTVDFIALQSEVEKKLKKLKNEKVSAELAISQGRRPIYKIIIHYQFLLCG
nr:unnamed protein product [Callosobruchus chinensis]